MGRISEYIIELGEMFDSYLEYSGDWETAKEALMNELSPDEYEFFEAHEDIIRENIDRGDDYDLDQHLDLGEHPMDESIEMHPLHEDFGIFQQAGLVITAGAIAIAIIKGKGSDEASSWKAWAENKLDFIPKFKKKRIKRESGEGLRDYADGKIDLEALEEIIFQDERIQEIIEEMKKGDKTSYTALYNFIKSSMGRWSITDTPGKEIKKEYFRQGDEYKTELEEKKNEAKDVLQWFANGDASISEVIEVLSKYDEREWIRLKEEFAKLIENPIKYRNFYSALESFYKVYDLKETPGKAIRKRLADEKKSSPAQKFNVEESLEMPTLSEYGEEKDDWKKDHPDYYNIDGRWLHKNSREYKYWERNEREWGDDPRDHERRPRY